MDSDIDSSISPYYSAETTHVMDSDIDSSRNSFRINELPMFWEWTVVERVAADPSKLT